MTDERRDPEDKRSDPPSEGVRIIGAEEAAEALERGDVAQRRGDDQPRYGDRPTPAGHRRPAARAPLPARLVVGSERHRARTGGPERADLRARRAAPLDRAAHRPGAPDPARRPRRGGTTSTTGRASPPPPPAGATTPPPSTTTRASRTSRRGATTTRAPRRPRRPRAPHPRRLLHLRRPRRDRHACRARCSPRTPVDEGFGPDWADDEVARLRRAGASPAEHPASGGSPTTATARSAPSGRRAAVTATWAWP